MTMDQELGLLHLPSLRPDQVQLAQFGNEFSALASAESAKLRDTQRLLTDHAPKSTITNARQTGGGGQQSA
jgi:hypothetical protein